MEDCGGSNVWIWGQGSYGRNAQGDEGDQLAPVNVCLAKKTSDCSRWTTQTSFVALAYGAAHMLALNADGELFSWGKCHVGQLGHGEDEKDEFFPRRVTFPNEETNRVRLVRIAAGFSHSFALDTHGGLWSWGLGYWGLTGHGIEKNYNRPTLIVNTPWLCATSTLDSMLALNFSGGEQHSLFWVPVVDESAQAENVLWSVGKNDRGQCGCGKSVKIAKKPQRVLGIPALLTNANETKLKVKIKSVFCGRSTSFIVCSTSCDLDSDGAALFLGDVVYAVGRNDHGELGIGTRTDAFEATLMKLSPPQPSDSDLPDLLHVKKIVNAGSVTYILLESGLVFACGQSVYFSLQENANLARDFNSDAATTEPVLLALDEPIDDIQAGNCHVIALTRLTRSVITWGEAVHGTLGDGISAPAMTRDRPVLDQFGWRPTTVTIPAPNSRVTAIVAGSSSSAVLVEPL